MVVVICMAELEDHKLNVSGFSLKDIFYVSYLLFQRNWAVSYNSIQLRVELSFTETAHPPEEKSLLYWKILHLAEWNGGEQFNKKDHYFLFEMTG